MEKYLNIEMPTQTFNRGGYDPKDNYSRDSTAKDWNMGFAKFSITENAEYDYDKISINILPPIDVNKDIHCLLAVWSSGDSFGRDEDSDCEIFALSNDLDNINKAQNILESLKDENNYSSEYYKKRVDLCDGYQCSRRLPWHGYFESLSYTSIITRNV